MSICAPQKWAIAQSDVKRPNMGGAYLSSMACIRKLKNVCRNKFSTLKERPSTSTSIDWPILFHQATSYFSNIFPPSEAKWLFSASWDKDKDFVRFGWNAPKFALLRIHPVCSSCFARELFQSLIWETKLIYYMCRILHGRIFTVKRKYTDSWNLRYQVLRFTRFSNEK